MPFLNTLKVEHIGEDDAKFFGEGEWRLLEGVDYWDASGRLWSVPSGFTTDFASVPRLPFAYWLTGGTGHRAAVVHDYLCRTGYDRKVADALFHEMLLSTGVNRVRSWIMWVGVRIGHAVAH
jgi:hypothetical protein